MEGKTEIRHISIGKGRDVKAFPLRDRARSLDAEGRRGKEK